MTKNENKVLLCSMSHPTEPSKIYFENLISCYFVSVRANKLFKLWPYSIIDGWVNINRDGKINIYNNEC